MRRRPLHPRRPDLGHDGRRGLWTTETTDDSNDEEQARACRHAETLPGRAGGEKGRRGGGDVAIRALMSRELDDVLLSLAMTMLTSKPVGLLVRHAERGPIADLARHHEVLLTDDGIAAARSSGVRLAARLRDAGINDDVVIVHSPVERCGQTARGIADGLRDAGITVDVIGVAEPLGANYLKDPARVAAEATKSGHRFVRDWFDGVLGKDVISSCQEVADALVGVYAALLAKHRFVVGVSHDWNIAAVREHTLGLRYEDVGWPPFLDGVVLTLNDDGSGRVHCVHSLPRAA